MDLRALRYFVCVAEARSFSKAAVLLRVAQPALSRQIRKLEDELGVELLSRTGRELRLTEGGALLLSRGRFLTEQVVQLGDDIRSRASELRGAASIGVSPATCEMLAPMIVRDCARLHPQLTLTFVEGFSGFLFERLMQQALSLCLMHNPPGHKDLEIHPLLVEAMYLVGPGPGSDGLPPVERDAELEGLPLILPNPGHTLRTLIDSAVRARGGTLSVAVQTDGFVTTKALVAAGLGYTILPFSAVHREVGLAQLSAARLDGLDIPWTLCLAYRRDQRGSRLTAALRDVIQAGVDTQHVRFAADGTGAAAGLST